MADFKKYWLPRILTGALAGVAACLLLAFLTQPGSMFGVSLSFDVRDFTFCYNSRVPDALGAVLGLLLWAAFGAEAGMATIPFADTGRETAVRSLVHFGAMTATLWAWVLLNFAGEPLPGLALSFQLPFTLVYLLIWLGRWVGWYAEVAQIREILGLASGPSPLKWRESLPHIGFAFLLCLVVPALLRLWDARDVPVLSGLLYPYLLLPVGAFCSACSLGKRQGFCPLYPVSCALFILIFILPARLFSNMADGFLLPVAFFSALTGNLAGAAWRRTKRGRGV